MDPVKYKKGLAIAFIGAAMTLIGDFLIGANPAAPELTGVMMADLFRDAAGNSDLRMVLGGMLGAVGISFIGVGYFQIYQLLKNQKGVMPFIYWVSALMYIGLAEREPTSTALPYPCFTNRLRCQTHSLRFP